MSTDTNHGVFGSDASNFIKMLPARVDQHSKAALASLAVDMESGIDTIDPGPDPEENLFAPAGYTYFGQFIDHDLTFDTTSTFDGVNVPTNQRTPRFDLDSIYGKGPIDETLMYESDKVHLKLGRVLDPVTDRRDLLRRGVGTAERAVIGDPRNDENSIVSQIHSGMVRFHNKVVDRLQQAQPALSGAELFNAARNEVRWTYQRILVEDFLRRLIDKDVIADFDSLRQPDDAGRSQNEAAFVLYPLANRAALPIEFSGAAYRFGHSMVRNGYFLQDGQSFLIFDGKMDANSLVGFQSLPEQHFIRDWERFFPNSKIEGSLHHPAPGEKGGTDGVNDSEDDAPGHPRLQFAYRLDPSIANPLRMLPASVADDPPPSLIVRNLWRAAAFQLPFGQDFAEALGIPALDPKYLCVRRELQRNAEGLKQYRFEQIQEIFWDRTPLWFYMLAEAQKATVDALSEQAVFNENDLETIPRVTGTQLGQVGGRILLEVFNGLLDSDPDSYRNHPDAKTWKAMVAKMRMWDVLLFE
jgi:hypothetical protein